MNSIIEAFSGKRTYIIAFIGAAIGLAEAYGVTIPPAVYTILGFLGLYTLRSAVAKAETAAS